MQNDDVTKENAQEQARTPATLQHQGEKTMTQTASPWSRNEVIFMGRSGKDPEMNYTPKGKALTKFSLAIDQGKSKDAMWLTVTSWEALAEQVNVTVNKGDLVEVRGRLSVNKYNDRYYY